MIKFRTISLFPNAATFPHLSADIDINNYSVMEMNQGTKKAVYATAATAGKDLAIVMQEFWNRTGDFYFTGKILEAKKKLLLVSLEALATRELDIDAKHINGSLDGSGNLIVALDAALVPDGTGNLVVGTAPTSGVYLKVTGFTTLTEKAVTAQIIKI